MNIYRITLFLFLFLFLFEEYLKVNKQMYKYLKILSIILLVILAGCRGVLARDDKMYVDLFNNFNFSYTFFKESRFEILYLLLNGVIKFFTQNFNFLFFIIALLSLYNVYKFINYFSVSFFYSLTFYYCRWFFTREFTQIRNGLAYSFFCLGLIELYKKNEKKYYFYILVGSLIHKSIFFCMVFPIFIKFLNRHLKSKEKFVYLTILLIPLINTKLFLNKILSALGVPQDYLIGIFSKKNTDIVYFYSILFLFVLILFDKKLKLLFRMKYIFLKKVYIFSCLTAAILFYYGYIAGRLSSFFNVEFLLQDKLLKLFKHKLILRIILSIFLILLYYINFTLRLEMEYWNYFK